MTTGEVIKSARKKAGMTQKELGEKLGITYQTVAQWENNLRKPKFETLERIANALGIHPYSLMSDEQAMRALENSLNADYRITMLLDQMTTEGKLKVAEYAEDILPRYRRQKTPAEEKLEKE